VRAWVALVTVTSTVVVFSYAAHAAVEPLIAVDLGLNGVQLGPISTTLCVVWATRSHRVRRVGATDRETRRR